MPQYSYLRQTATLWPAGDPEASGVRTVGDPEEIRVRWVSGRSEDVDREGNTIALDATATVAQAIAIGSIMALGTLADWGEVGTGDVSELGDLMEVIDYKETPDLKARHVQRSVSLKRYRGTLPVRV